MATETRFDPRTATLSQIHWHNAKGYEESAAGCKTEAGRKSILALAQREYGKAAAAALVEAAL
jgi:hypothetical protein